MDYRFKWREEHWNLFLGKQYQVIMLFSAMQFKTKKQIINMIIL